MPSSQTPNYKLSQWSKSDRVQMEDFNADNAKIDGALKAQDAALAAEASARQSAIAAEADARNSAVAQLTALVSQRGNCKIWTTTYAGSDRYGSANPCTLNFPGRPLMVFIGECGAGTNNTGMFACILQGQVKTYAQSHYYSALNLSWSGSSLSWYCNDSAVSQLNSKLYTYRVVALLEA